MDAGTKPTIYELIPSIERRIVFLKSISNINTNAIKYLSLKQRKKQDSDKVSETESPIVGKICEFVIECLQEI